MTPKDWVALAAFVFTVLSACCWMASRFTRLETKVESLESKLDGVKRLEKRQNWLRKQQVVLVNWARAVRGRLDQAESQIRSMLGNG